MPSSLNADAVDDMRLLGASFKVIMIVQVPGTYLLCMQEAVRMYPALMLVRLSMQEVTYLFVAVRPHSCCAEDPVRTVPHCTRPAGVHVALRHASRPAAF